jgi:hypothetical protein
MQYFHIFLLLRTFMDLRIQPQDPTGDAASDF